MGQLEDFRASLKRKDSAVSSEGEIPVKSIAKAKQEKMKRRTLGVSGELHLELKALSVWRIKSHPKASPGITDTIQEMMRVYYKKYPEAKMFVDEFCGFADIAQPFLVRRRHSLTSYRLHAACSRSPVPMPGLHRPQSCDLPD